MIGAVLRQRQWLRLTWPREITPEQSSAALLSLNGLSTPRRRDALVLRATGERGVVRHEISVPVARVGAVRRQLHAALPGLSFESVDQPAQPRADQVWRAWLSTRQRPLELRTPEPIATALLAALASAKDGEALVLQWTLGPVHRPRAVPSKVSGTLHGGWLGGLMRGPFAAPADLDAEARRALTNKQSLPGWRATLHIVVRATGRKRQRQLLGRVSAAIRMAQAPAAHVGFTKTFTSAVDLNRLPWRWPLVINTAELRALAAWPIGATEMLPVERLRSRGLPPSPTVAGAGRVVASSTWPGASRDLALNPPGALRHLHLLGPTGVGKSTVLLNLITSDLEAGRAVVVIEPKGDLIRDVLERVPAHRLDDVVVIDPIDDAPVGLNPLAGAARNPELVVDQLLAVFKGLFGDYLGPRTQDLLTAGLQTLTYAANPSLVALPLLFTDAAFRRQVLSQVREPLAIEPFWRWFEHLSAAERRAVLAPLMNKLNVFLLRPAVRRVIGQPRPRFDLRSVFTQRRVLLVNLAKGHLGPEASKLLGSLVLSQLWQTALGRQSIDPRKRHPVMVFVDEFQDYVALPTDLADVMAQARGIGVGFTLAHQHLNQLPPHVRAAVLANAASRVVFRTSEDDARIIAREDERLTSADIRGLGPYEVYASLVGEDGASTSFASGRTLEPSPALQSAGSVQARSRARFGVPRAEIDAALDALVTSERGRKHASSTGEGFGTVRRSRSELDTDTEAQR